MDLFGLLDVPLWLPLTLLCIALLFTYGYYPMSTWTRLGVPGPPPLPFIGNVHQFLNPKTGIRASVSQWQRQYGKVFGIQFFRKPCLVVTDPELFSDILVKDFNTFHDRFTLGGDFIPEPVLKGVAFQSGKDWKRNRRIMTQTFTMGKLKMLTGYMNSTTRQLAKKLQENARLGTVTEAKPVFGAFSLDVIAGTAFGLEINSQDKQDDGIYAKVKAIMEPKKVLKLAMAFAGIFPFTGRILKNLNVSLFDPESIEYFRIFLGKLVNERKKHPDQFERWDFFQLLLDAEAEGEEDSASERMLKPEEVVYHGITFIMAGYETTASTLQFVSHILASHHDVQDKLVQEIESVLSETDIQEEGSGVTYEHCQRLKYMEAVLYETLRMFPPVHQIKREAVRDTVLAGIPVPKNAGIIIPIYNVGRDPELFPDPDTFRPERFMSDESSSLAPSVKPIHFLPFGFGPRQCLGMRLALIEMKIALVHILKKVYIQNVQPTEMDLEDYTGFLAPKQPFRITMTSLG